jgi:vacuolar iron transporter family protein
MASPPLSSAEKGHDSSSSLLRTHLAGESHSDAADIIRDIIIGFADGLTVPFALTAGLSSLGSSKLVITGGLAELFSGAISMGLGAYLAAVTERDRYLNEEKREREEVATKPEAERQEIYDIFAQYGISKNASKVVVDDLVKNEDNWVRVGSEYLPLVHV